MFDAPSDRLRSSRDLSKTMDKGVGEMNKILRGPILAVALAAVVVGPALATAGAGFHQTIQIGATVDGRIHAQEFGDQAGLEGPGRLRDRDTRDRPTGNVRLAHASGCRHRQRVPRGSVTFYDEGCNATVHAAGSAFVESGDDPGLVRNLSATTPATVNATYIVPAGNAECRASDIDKDNPGCPQS